MGRKHKFVNKTHYPDWAIERFTRCIFDDVIEFFSTEEGRAEYEQWEREQEELKKNKRAAAMAARSVYMAFFLRGPLGLELGKIGAPLGKYSCS